MPANSQILEALKSLEHAAPSAAARWCVRCGLISVVDVEEVVLSAGDPDCPSAPLQGTPQQCMDAFTQPQNAAGAAIQRLRDELAALDDLLSRPKSNEERSRLLAEREKKADALEALTKT